MSRPEALISYAEFNHYLVPLGALNSPSELHGWLAGKLCGGQRLSSDDWMLSALTFLDVVTDDSGVVGDADGSGQAAIARIYPVTLAQLQDPHFSFDLLLPDDDESLELRAACLGEWCHGFLSGFGSAGLAGEQQIPAESAESLRDLAAIANIGAVVDEQEEDAETNLFELIEYVRMAALTLFADFGGEPALANPVIH